MTMTKLKVIIIGPEGAGKTLISNILSDMLDGDFAQYETTQGVRILEVETVSNSSLDPNNAEIELWDCGGSSRYQSCWPVFQLDADGVIFVFNPDAKEQLPELELLYDYFIVQSGLSDFKCLIFVNLRNEVDESSINLPHRCRGVMKKFVNGASSPNKIRSEFHNYIDALLTDWRRRFRL